MSNPSRPSLTPSDGCFVVCTNKNCGQTFFRLASTQDRTSCAQCGSELKWAQTVPSGTVPLLPPLAGGVPVEVVKYLLTTRRIVKTGFTDAGALYYLELEDGTSLIIEKGVVTHSYYGDRDNGVPRG